MSMFESWLIIIKAIPSLACIFVCFAALAGIWALVRMSICWLSYPFEDGKYVTKKDELIVEITNKKEIEEFFIDCFPETVKSVKGCVVLFILFCSLGQMIPSREELAAILIIPYVSNNPEFKKLPDNLIHKINELLKDTNKEESK